MLPPGPVLQGSLFSPSHAVYAVYGTAHCLPCVRHGAVKRLTQWQQAFRQGGQFTDQTKPFELQPGAFRPVLSLDLHFLLSHRV